MFFKRKPRDEDIEDIKQAVEPMPPMPMEQYYEKPKEGFAPLFVKVEKYRETLAEIAEMRSFVAGLKHLLVIINDIEALRNDAHKIMRTTIQRLDKSLIEIDTELLRPKGFEIEFPTSEVDVHRIEDSMTELQKQITSLKRELESME